MLVLKCKKKLVADVKGKNSNEKSDGQSSSTFNVIKNELTDFQLKYHAEVDRRRNIEKRLFVEKSRTSALSLQLKNEIEENRKLHEQIGALNYELSQKQVSQSHYHAETDKIFASQF